MRRPFIRGVSPNVTLYTDVAHRRQLRRQAYNQNLDFTGTALSTQERIADSARRTGGIPAQSGRVAWLAKKFAPHGIALEPGQVVLAGSFTRPMPVAAGDTIHADYGALGALGCRFV